MEHLQPRHLKTHHINERWFTLIHVGGILIVWWICSLLVGHSYRQFQERLGQNQATVEDTLRGEIEKYMFGLQGTKGIVVANNFHPSPAGYRRYAESRDLFESFRGSLGFGFIRRVAAEKMSKYKTSKFTEFKVHPDVTSNQHMIIELIEPIESNKPALGLDVSFETNRRTAAELAGKSGLPTLTKKITLVQQSQKHVGFLFYIPVYDTVSTPTSETERESSLVGWAYTPIVLEKLIENVSTRLSDVDRIEIVIPGHDETIAIGHTHRPTSFLMSNSLSREIALGQSLWTVTTYKDTLALNKELLLIFLVCIFGIAAHTYFTRMLKNAFSQQKKSQSDSETWMHGLVHSSGYGIISTSPLGVIRTFNPSAANTIQRLTASCIDKVHISDIINFTPVSSSIANVDRERCSSSAEWFTSLAIDLQKKAQLTLEVIIPEEEGGSRHIQMQFSRIVNPQHELLGYLVSLQDITERKQVHEELIQSRENALRAAHVAREARSQLELAEVAGRFGSWTINLETMQTTWSLGHKRLFGLRATDRSPTYDEYLQMVHEDDRQILRNALEIRSVGRQSKIDAEYRIYSSHHDQRTMKIHGDVSFDSQNTPISIIGTIQDITDIKRMEMRLISSREEAMAATKAKSMFLATMSHELRTPLNGIIGSSTILQGTALDESQRQMVNMIHECSHTLVTLISDILDFSKIESGKLDIERVPFDARQAAEDAIRMVQQQADSKSIRLHLSVHPSVPKVVVTDFVRFRQILLNLLSNAIKFTERGQIHVTIDTFSPSQGAIGIRTTVEDTGIGISKDQQDRLFQDFSQADASITRRYGGSGLGLAICKKLCELLGGNIDVKSTPGKGSSFTYDIPIEIGQDSAAINRKAQNTSDSLNLGQDYPLKILVAEDNQTNQVVIKALFRKLQYEIKVVENGLKAIEAISNEHFDIVFMDLQMPEMDGLTATKLIRKLPFPHNRIYVIALTANISQQDHDECTLVGMNDFLTKPIDLNMLKQSLCTFIETHPMTSKTNAVKQSLKTYQKSS